MATLYHNDHKKLRVLTVNSIIQHLPVEFQKCIFQQRNTVSEITQHANIIKISNLHRYKMTEYNNVDNNLKELLSTMTNKQCVERHVALDEIFETSKLNNLDNLFKEVFKPTIKAQTTTIQLDIIVNNNNEIQLSKTKNYLFILQKSLKQYIIELYNQFFKVRDFIQHNQNKIQDYFDFKHLIQNKETNLITSSNFNNFITFVHNLDLQYIYDFIKNNKINDYELRRKEIGLLLESLEDVNVLIKGIRINKASYATYLKFGCLKQQYKHIEDNPYFISYLVKHNLFDPLIFKLNRLKLMAI